MLIFSIVHHIHTLKHKDTNFYALLSLMSMNELLDTIRKAHTHTHIHTMNKGEAT